MIALQLIFWIGLFLVLYTYWFFPLILKALAGQRSIRARSYEPEEFPVISVLMAAYNEEKVIDEKIGTVLRSSYPEGKMEILVGSDASTDRTNEILEKRRKSCPAMKLFLFETRTGKPGIINRLASEARGEILVITDANVMFEEDTLFELVRFFKEESISLVDSRMISTGVREGGISLQEQYYSSREVRVKHCESVLWGSMMGPSGGCYAVRKSAYTPVPDRLLVDDFFINMSVLAQGASCISNLQARAREDVSNSSREEFRRKKRISAGNYQNLFRFLFLLFRGRKGVGFCFLSHKLIRWLVPFLAMGTLSASLLLGRTSLPYFLAFLLQFLLLLSPVIDHILRKIRIQSLPLHFISHFVLMNMAMLAGFFRFAGGIKSNVWQPTKRYQD